MFRGYQVARTRLEALIKDRTRNRKGITLTEVDRLGVQELRIGRDVVRMLKGQMLDDGTLVYVGPPSSRTKLVIHKNNRNEPVAPAIALEGERQHASHLGQAPNLQSQVFAPAEGAARLYIRNVSDGPIRSVSLTAPPSSKGRRRNVALVILSCAYLGVGECSEVPDAQLSRFRDAAVGHTVRDIRLKGFRAAHMAGEPLPSETELALTQDLRLTFKAAAGQGFQEGVIILRYRPSSDRWEGYSFGSDVTLWSLR